MGRKPGIPRICLVCGDIASGINFSVASCMSCKTFFRRNALQQKEVNCQFSDSCSIDRITRKFCTKCRLRKCFTVGMKKEMIKSDDEKEELQAKVRLNRMKRLAELKHSTQYKTQSQQARLSTDNSSFILLEPVPTFLFTSTSTSTSSSPKSSNLTSESTTAMIENRILPESESNKESIMNGTENIDEMLDAFVDIGSTIDKLCDLNDTNSLKLDLSDIEILPLEYAPKQIVNSESLTSLSPNQTETLRTIDFEPEFASLIPNYSTIEHIGFPIDQLILPEQNLLLEIVSACSVLHNPYKRIEDFRFETPHCKETAEFTFYRLIRMSKRLNAFRRFDIDDQDRILKHSLIAMLCMRTAVMFNKHRKAWAFVNDRSKSSVMFRVDTIRPYCVKVGYERQENFPFLFRDEWKQDEAIFDLLTVIVLFAPNVHYKEPDKIHFEQHRYIRLLHRYLQVKYCCKSDADECFHQLMYNLKECDLLTESLVTFFRSIKGTTSDGSRLFQSYFPQNL